MCCAGNLTLREPVMDYVHLLVSQNWFRVYYKSSGDFRLGARCFNGSFHAKLTENKSLVNCPECLKFMKA